MRTKPAITIIGATGSMGTAIAGCLVKYGYRTLLHSREMAKAEALAATIRRNDPLADVEAISCSYQASWEADIIIAAVPGHAEKELAEHIKAVANQKIIISIANPFTATSPNLRDRSFSSAAEELQELLPHSRIVKAFNTLSPAAFRQQGAQANPIPVFLAGNDADACATVSELAATMGFNPLIAGDLSVAGTLERMQGLLSAVRTRYGIRYDTAWSLSSGQDQSTFYLLN